MASTVRVVGARQALARLDRDIEEVIADETNETLLSALNLVTQATPVDSGRARRSWQVETLADRDSLDRATLVNSVDYIEPLNNGHSQQAPARFIQTAFRQAGFDQVDPQYGVAEEINVTRAPGDRD